VFADIEMRTVEFAEADQSFFVVRRYPRPGRLSNASATYRSLLSAKSITFPLTVL
jgi:hypothetical protein